MNAVGLDPAVVLHRPAGGLAARDVLVLQDGAQARTDAGVPMVLAVRAAGPD